MRRNLILGAVVAVLFFGGAEALLRLSGRVPTDALRSPTIETLDGIPGLYTPGQDFVDRIRPELAYHVHINSLGFRGAEFDALKAPDVIRILCVGDSYTFGHYVDDASPFPARLGARLEKAVPGRRIEVINGGANGFTIVDEKLFLQTKGLSLEPDLVILVFSNNDIQDLARPRPMIEVMRDHARLKSRFVIGPALRFLQHTAIFNGMQRAAAWLEVRRRKESVRDASVPVEPLWERYVALLRETRDLLDAHGVRLLLVAWPSAEQAAATGPVAPIERLGVEAADLGIDFLDLTPTMRALASAGVNPSLAPLDGHPSAEGHEAAAGTIATRLMEPGEIVDGPPEARERP